MDQVGAKPPKFATPNFEDLFIASPGASGQVGEIVPFWRKKETFRWSRISCGWGPAARLSGGIATSQLGNPSTEEILWYDLRSRRESLALQLAPRFIGIAAHLDSKQGKGLGIQVAMQGIARVGHGRQHQQVVLEGSRTVLQVRNRTWPSHSQGLSAGAVEQQVVQVVVGNPTKGAFGGRLKNKGVSSRAPAALTPVCLEKHEPVVK